MARDAVVEVLLIIGLVLGAAACGRPVVETRPPSILLISIDALRADHLSCYGYDRRTSPVIDELASRGIRFSKSFVNTHGTPPSHTTLLSSLYQETHQVDLDGSDEHPNDHRIPDEVELVQEILRGAGWHTIAVTGGGYMSAEFGFARGFDEFSDRARGVDQEIEKLAEALDGQAGKTRPVFALFHTYEVHSPYTPPAGFDRLFGEYSGEIEPTNEALMAIQGKARKVLKERDFDYLESLYDGGIRYTDQILGDLFSALEKTGFLDNAVVIITADHGEEFGEHGGVLHGGKLYEELLHVPLIVFGTGVERGIVDPRLVSLVDVAPTILSVAGLPIPAKMEGRDLLGGRPPAAWTDQRVFAQYGSQLYCVRTPRWKLIWRPAAERAQLFDLRHDPMERRNLVQEKPEKSARLLAEIEAWRRTRQRLDLAHRQQTELSTETVEELRALGYVE
jgi:arylsulfatase A-like enzyme